MGLRRMKADIYQAQEAAEIAERFVGEVYRLLLGAKSSLYGDEAYFGILRARFADAALDPLSKKGHQVQCSASFNIMKDETEYVS